VLVGRCCIAAAVPCLLAVLHGARTPSLTSTLNPETCCRRGCRRPKPRNLWQKALNPKPYTLAGEACPYLDASKIVSQNEQAPAAVGSTPAQSS
jgi:hypothetical protein